MFLLSSPFQKNNENEKKKKSLFPSKTFSRWKKSFLASFFSFPNNTNVPFPFHLTTLIYSAPCQTRLRAL